METLTIEQQRAIAMVLCYMHYNHETIVDGKKVIAMSITKVKSLFAFFMLQGGNKFDTQLPHKACDVIFDCGFVCVVKNEKYKKRQFVYVDWTIAEPFCKKVLCYDKNVYELMIETN